MGSSSIQFRGKENVLQAYESRNIAAWSLCQGKQMIFKHEGSELDEAAQALENCLDMLNGSSNAIYTLKVYEDTEKIKSNTPDDGSFNFRLNLDEQLATVGAVTRSSNNNEIISRLQAIEEKINGEDEEEEPEENKFLAGIMGNPMLQPIIQQALTYFAGNIFKPAAPAAPAAAGIAGVDPGELSQDQKIISAVQILKTKSACLGDDLLKLASIAEKQPAQFEMLLGMLKHF